MVEKTIAQSAVTENFTVHEKELNGYGLMHGGSLLTRCDETAFIAAYQHAERDCLTRAVYRARFHRPLGPDQHYAIHARVIDTGSSSIWVHCEVEHERQIAMDAIFVFVAVDDNWQPAAVPPVRATSSEEERLQREIRELRACASGRSASSNGN